MDALEIVSGGTPVKEMPEAANRVRLVNVLPILSIHLVCLGVIWVGWSWAAVAMAGALFFGRMFCITAFYHRYFWFIREFRGSVFRPIGINHEQNPASAQSLSA